MTSNRIKYSETISDDLLFKNFKDEFLSNDIDKCYYFMYDSYLKKNVKTENNKEYFLTTSEIFWSDADPSSKEISYRLNNCGHRSDDFTKLSKEKFNVLFAGCSTTFGQGLNIEDTWPKILYSILSKKYPDIGPFQSLGFPGGSCFKILNNISKYINLYGKPNIIFVLLPDYIRQEKYTALPKRLLDIDTSQSKKFYVNVFESAEERLNKGIVDEEGMYLCYHHIMILQNLCKLNDIKLFISSWDEMTNKRLLELNIEGYFDIAYDKSDHFINDHIKDNSDIIEKKYLFDARDKMHPGYMVHLYTAKRFLKTMEVSHD